MYNNLQMQPTQMLRKLLALMRPLLLVMPVRLQTLVLLMKRVLRKAHRKALLMLMLLLMLEMMVSAQMSVLQLLREQAQTLRKQAQMKQLLMLMPVMQTAAHLLHPAYKQLVSVQKPVNLTPPTLLPLPQQPSLQRKQLWHLHLMMPGEGPLCQSTRWMSQASMTHSHRGPANQGG